MGIRDFLSDLNEDRKRAQRKLKDEFLGFTSSASRKLIPRELRPALPFLAAAVPFMLPTSGIFASPLGRAIISSGANLTAQGLADPEAEELNLLSAALAGLTGAGTAPGASEGIRGLKFTGENPVTKEGILSQMRGAPIGADSILDASNVGVGKRLANLGLEGAAQITDFLGGSQDTFSKIGERPELAFTKAGAKELGKAITLPTSQAVGDFAYTEATKALREFNATQAAEMAQAGADMEAIAEARRNAIRFALEVNDFTEEDILETFNELGLKEGGIVSLAEGGMLDFGGKEMDLRKGGFVPIGKKEKADDVPARLSKNEFVMTADAVRAAGGGSVNKGAQRMYDLMNNLEARA